MLFQRRQGSYAAGQLGFPGGHVEADESAAGGLARELVEELGIAIEPTSARLVLMMFRAPEKPGDTAYLDLFFTVDQWLGIPRICEPDKCSALCWSTHVPAEVVPYLAPALEAIARGESLVEFGW